MLGKLTELQRVELLPGKDYLYITYMGSTVQGTYVQSEDDTNDKDLLGIYIDDLSHYLGVLDKGKSETYQRFVRGYDAVSHELRKYFRLLIASNPDALTSLWVRDNYHVLVSPPARRILESRDLFTSKRAYNTFAGYANNQFKLMERSEGEPTGSKGEKRKELIGKFGYDPKNAAHCIRLYQVLIEFLVEGKMTVTRPNASMLLDIKTGKWKLGDIKALATQLDHDARQAYITSSLPLFIDHDKVDTLSRSILIDHFQLRDRNDLTV